ncbi:MAG: glycerol-3-phosphate 1-O-acyltransferase PlsY [Verrucomicrobiales bacterium]|nr:glycerol-3-phosphate 1-O-acyltransferase PlsY [Verrucomicrobiales bacterium]
MTLEAQLCLGALIGFASGSLPFGYWAGRLRGIDIRQHGSGNIGATNVIRVLGKGIGVPVFILDLCKGLLPCLGVAAWMQASGVEGEMLSAGRVLTGMMAILGHMFTPWLNFRGGKGVATAAGVLLGIAPWAMLGGLVAWLVFFFLTRYVSLASMMAGVGVVVTMVVRMVQNGRWDVVQLSFGVILAVLVIVRHRSNISRLIAGTESKAGGGKAKG